MADDPEGLINIVERASEGIGYLEADIAQAEGAASRKDNTTSNSCERELNTTNSSSIRNENERTLDPSLPTIGLPKFDGDITQWPAFWSRFERAIHRSRMDDGDKLAYLQGLLIGKPYERIKGYVATEKN
uniref:Uncharacterized protein n=1 Tax=Syphacia muris TaxID=451379 RepID=A0A0N5B1M2_9BILA